MNEEIIGYMNVVCLDEPFENILQSSQCYPHKIKLT